MWVTDSGFRASWFKDLVSKSCTYMLQALAFVYELFEARGLVLPGSSRNLGEAGFDGLPKSCHEMQKGASLKN